MTLAEVPYSQTPFIRRVNPRFKTTRYTVSAFTYKNTATGDLTGELWLPGEKVRLAMYPYYPDVAIKTALLNPSPTPDNPNPATRPIIPHRTIITACPVLPEKFDVRFSVPTDKDPFAHVQQPIPL